MRAVETLRKAWAAEYGPAGVRVNCDLAGVIRTPESDEAAFVHGAAIDVGGGRTTVAA